MVNKGIVERTFEFAIKIVHLVSDLERKSSSAGVLGKQILRAGTSIGANVEEAQAGESRADFIHKYNIALKEARESKYWLRLLSASEIVSENDLTPLLGEADEISKVLGRIIINCRKKSKDVC